MERLPMELLLGDSSLFLNVSHREAQHRQQIDVVNNFPLDLSCHSSGATAASSSPLSRSSCSISPMSSSSLLSTTFNSAQPESPVDLCLTNRSLLASSSSSLSRSSPVHQTNSSTKMEVDSGAEFSHHQSTTRPTGFLCNYCSSIYSAATALRQHERLCHGDKLSDYPYFCKGCSQRFVSEHGLKTHIGKSKRCRLHRSPTAAAAAGSPSSNNNSISDSDHNDNNNETAFVCSFCPSVFMQPDYLRKHERRAHAEQLRNAGRLFVCSVCSSEFKSTRSLNAHLQSTACQMTFRQRLLERSSSSSTMQTTSTNGNAAYLVACSFCPSVFSAIGTLRKHERNFHQDQLAALTIYCKGCSKPFISQNALICHLRISSKCPKTELVSTDLHEDRQ